MNYPCLSFIDGEVEIIDSLSTAAQGLIASQVWSLCLKASITSLVHGMLLLLLLSRFSCVRLCVTPETAAHQVPPSLGFSRQEHWSGLPFPSPMHESEVAQSRPTLSDPMDCSLPGSFVHGIFQAKVLEWGATAFSGGQTIAMKFCQIHTKRRSSTTTKK